jgi:RecB family endonuclease NucS
MSGIYMEITNINKQYRDTEHTKILNYFKYNKGIKLDELESGLILAEGCKTGKIGPIFPNNIWDILCYKKIDKELVVIEVKSEIADYNTFGQILYYLSQIEVYTCANTNLGESNVNAIRGIILAKKIDNSLKELVKKYINTTPKIDLKKYDWGVEENLTYENINLSDDF